MIELNEQVNSLRNALAEVVQKIAELEAEAEPIAAKAEAEERQMTIEEFSQFFALNDEIGKLSGERYSLESAIETLQRYTR